ncbi:MAG: alpha/beta fold hydrolase [Anaerolineae bacterium]|nr:alpha/beta fold hydrolase [Anaerolineae bacterium]
MTITVDSTINEIRAKIPDFHTLICEALGHHVPEAMVKMLGGQTIATAAKKVGWDKTKLDDFINVLNECVKSTDRDVVETNQPIRKSRIELAEEQDIWIGHQIFWDRMPFKSDDWNFVFQGYLTTQAHGGPQTGELFYAASEIQDGSNESLTKVFRDLAHRVETRAEACLQKGHTVSAREAYLRACAHYRMPMWFIPPLEPEFRPLMDSMRACFRKAAALFEPQVEIVDIPFEGKNLPLYLQRGRPNGTPRPTVIMLNGGESFAEDGYFTLAPACLKRGYNFVTVDVPGQGGTPFDGLYLRPDMEVPLGAVLDYVSSLPDVDSDRIATYGVSLGGYIGPRAAVFDKRIKAIVANSALTSMYDLWMDLWKRIGPLLTYQLEHADPAQIGVLKSLAWRWGGDDPLQIPELNKGFEYDPRQITCPVLMLVGEGEYRSSSYIRSVQQHCLDVLPNSNKRLIVTPADEGAAHHCLYDNLALAIQEAFDWLDETFCNDQTRTD